MATNPAPQTLYFDWKEFSPEAEKQLRKVLNKFGILVYNDPTTEGMDGYGFILSTEALSNKKLARVGLGANL